jgi:hypothetical protein
LPKNLADNPEANVIFVLLNYQNDNEDVEKYLAEKHEKTLQGKKLFFYNYPGAATFHMAHAKNLAHRCGILQGADVLVNLDADNLTGPHFGAYIAQRFAERENIFLWARMLPGILPRGISGRIAVSARAFVKAGGYDEQFDTWGYDDKDFNHRLQRLGYHAEEIPARFLNGVPHSDKMRFREYPHVRGKDSGYTKDLDAGDATIANFGNFGCGEVKPFPDGPSSALGWLPTRVFGIGLHRTGTRSLDAAFRLLGLDSWHWKSAHEAKAIWLEMNAEGRSQTLEKYYALSDLPIPLLYRQLDLAYPNSKFILTVRNEGAWLASVRRHWSAEHNRFRAAWDTDPFTHKVHTALYGQKEFSEETFRERFERHNREVIDYFANQIGDGSLLIVNMDKNPGWRGLCEFLDLPEPSEPYPEVGKRLVL